MSTPAEAYERFMVPPLFRPWARRLVDAAAPRPGERVLDLACGTAIVARETARRLGDRAAIVAVDRSPTMLAVARRAAAQERLAARWCLASADALPLAPSCFDVVLCQFAMMFFDDHAAAAREMRRVVTGSGRVLASVWQGLDRHPFYATLHRSIERRVGISALGEIFSLGSGGGFRELFTDAGFRDVTVMPMSMTARFPDPDSFLAGEIDVDTAAIPSMQHADAATRRDIVTAIAAEMRQPLAAVTHDHHVVLEFHAHLLTASPGAPPASDAA